MNIKTLSIIAGVVVVAGGLYVALDYQNKSAEPKGANTMSERIGNGGTDELKIEVLREGSGDGAKAGDTVAVHYTGTLSDGRKFDSSVDRGEPFAFQLGAGQVIRGWDEGLVGMKIGEKRRLTIPPSLGYGTAGAGGVIPPHATLILVVGMVKTH